MRRWLRRLLKGPNQRSREMEPSSVTPLFEGLEGQWAAVKDGKVVEVARTPDALFMALRSRNIKNATILRVPAHDDPEPVGLG